jgi:predicted esterase
MKKIAPQPKLTIAIGSAGNISYAGANNLGGASSRFTLLSGKSDSVLPDAKAFVTELKKKGAQVDFRTYNGGHEVPFDLLGTVLASS